jgi:hypothetical protein
MSGDWVDFAVARPMPYVDAMPDRRQVPVLIAHTNGGGTDNGSLYGWFSRPGNTVCAHFQVMDSGVVEQYMPLSKQAFAQYDGNPFGISVEFQDNGNPSRELTTAQLDTSRALIVALAIPSTQAGVDGSPPGYGWHAMYQAWNQSGHTCPGPVRIAQWLDLFLYPQPNPLEADPMLIITRGGKSARLLTTDATGTVVHAVMSSSDWSAFNHLAPGALVISDLSGTDYDNLVEQHGG